MKGVRQAKMTVQSESLRKIMPDAGKTATVNPWEPWGLTVVQVYLLIDPEITRKIFG
jgi:hypothetical protein